MGERDGGEGREGGKKEVEHKVDREGVGREGRREVEEGGWSENEREGECECVCV